MINSDLEKELFQIKYALQIITKSSFLRHCYIFRFISDATFRLRENTFIKPADMLV